MKEYGELIARYAADVVGHNQHALCSTQLRNIRGAVDEMRGVVAMLPEPRHLPGQPRAVRELRRRFSDSARRKRATVAASRTRTRCSRWRSPSWGRASCAQAGETYQKLGTMGALGASLAASGLGDIAAVEGRFADAVRILEQGAAADLAAQERRRGGGEVRGAGVRARLARAEGGRRLRRPDSALANSKGGNDPVPGGARLRRGGRAATRRRRRRRASRPSSSPSCRPTPRSSTANIALKKRPAARGDQDC